MIYHDAAKSEKDVYLKHHEDSIGMIVYGLI